MNFLYNTIVQFQQYVILREGLGFASQMLPLLFLTLRAFRENLSSHQKRMIGRIAVVFWVFYVVVASLVEFRIYVPDAMTSRGGSRLIDFFSLSLLFAFSAIVMSRIHLSIVKRALMLLLINNYLLFATVLSKIYSTGFHNSAINFIYPYRLDALLVYAVILLATLPIVVRVIDSFSTQIVILPSRMVRFWLLLFPGLALMVQSAMFIYVMSRGEFSRYQVYVLLGLFISLVPGFLMTMVIIELIMRKHVVEEQAAELVRGYARVQNHIDAVHEMKHDLADHLHSVALLLEGGRHEDAHTYIDELIDLSEVNDRIFYSSHPLINGIINYCMMQADDTPVYLDARIQTDDYTPLNDREITVILRNMLMNAVEELEVLPPDTDQHEATIDLKMATVNKNLIVSCCNRITEDLKWEGGRPVTTKAQTMDGERGHGLALLQNIAARHRGRLRIEADDEQFRISILIPQK